MTRYPPGPLAISIGDPAGIGAEVIAKCWDNRGRFELPPFVAIGDPRSIEAVWEVLENSEFVIRRYREQTAALGYHGDTIVNSLDDILVCGLGFVVAHRLGFRRTFALFVLTEVTMALWIRDNLTLNVLMLIYPIEAVKEWQAAAH